MAPDPDVNKELIAQGFAQRLGKLYSAGSTPTVLRPKKSDSGEPASEPHVSNQLLVKGNLFKGTKSLADGQKIDATYYPWNAWNFVGAKGKPNRDAYKGSPKGMNPLPAGYAFYAADNAPNFNPEYKRRDLKAGEIQQALAAAVQDQQNATAATQAAADATVKLLQRLLEQAKKAKDKTGQSLPYKWEAHHILPMSAFFRYLEKEHISVVLASEYDINSGENMIMLPAQSEAMAIHGLPGHWSDHPQYTAKLQSLFNDRIVDEIDRIKSEEEPHENLPAKVEEKLHDMESSQFDLLKSMGPTRLV